MHLFLTTQIALALVFFVIPISEPETTTSLTNAIKTFNAEAATNPIGKNQPALTGEEVIAAIRALKQKQDPLVSDELFRTFKQIAETQELPPNVGFETTTLWDPDGEFVFDVWWVRLQIPKEDGGMYSFPIRERFVSSRTLCEEVIRLEKVLQDTPPLPGRYRIEERIQQLRTMIKNKP